MFLYTALHGAYFKALPKSNLEYLDYFNQILLTNETVVYHYGLLNCA